MGESERPPPSAMPTSTSCLRVLRQSRGRHFVMATPVGLLTQERRGRHFVMTLAGRWQYRRPGQSRGGSFRHWDGEKRTDKLHMKVTDFHRPQTLINQPLALSFTGLIHG